MGRTPSTRAEDGGKIASSIVDGSWARIPNKAGKLKKIYHFGTRKCDMQCRPLVTKAIISWRRLLLFGLQWWVRETRFAGARMFVCRTIIDIGARTSGPIGIGEVQFDGPGQRKDYGDNFRVTSGMRHVTRAKLQTLAKNIYPMLQTKAMYGFDSNLVFR